MHKEIEWLFNLEWKLGWKLDTKRIEKVMSKLGNPQNSFKTIHIAGTNGKGSTAAMINQILIENKKKGVI